jgi:hypothetical protein
MADPTAILIPMEDSLLHHHRAPFCYDPSCPCHEDALLIAPSPRRCRMAC